MDLLLTFLICAILSVLITRPFGRLACRWGIVDLPDEGFKTHDRPIPLVGGPVILLACIAGLVVMMLLPGNGLAASLVGQQQFLGGFFCAALVIVGIGVLDDLLELRGRHKLLGQVVAVCILLQSGVIVRRVQILDYPIELGSLAGPLTMMWLLGAINSLNMIDGMDGLASCVGLIISLALAGLAFIADQTLAAYLALALGGALFGFLKHNFPPARVFLGDSGSMLIGLAVGVLAIHGSWKGPATLALAAPIAIMAIPFFDTSIAILRRKLTGRSIAISDRGHLHHCLKKRGLSNQAVLFLFASIISITVAAGLNHEPVALITACAVVIILVVTRVFGHAELVLLKNRLWATARSFLHGSRKSHQHEVQIHSRDAGGWAAIWESVVAQAEAMNLKSLRLDVFAAAVQDGYHASWWSRRPENENLGEGNIWKAELPVVASGRTVGRLSVTGHPDDAPAFAKVKSLVQLLEDDAVLVPVDFSS